MKPVSLLFDHPKYKTRHDKMYPTACANNKTTGQAVDQ